ncbi:MAG: hypothetical protein ABI743_02045 [bacterium]
MKQLRPVILWLFIALAAFWLGANMGLGRAEDDWVRNTDTVPAEPVH